VIPLDLSVTLPIDEHNGDFEDDGNDNDNDNDQHYLDNNYSDTLDNENDQSHLDDVGFAHVLPLELSVTLPIDKHNGDVGNDDNDNINDNDQHHLDNNYSDVSDNDNDQSHLDDDDIAHVLPRELSVTVPIDKDNTEIRISTGDSLPRLLGMKNHEKSHADDDNHDTENHDDDNHLDSDHNTHHCHDDQHEHGEAEDADDHCDDDHSEHDHYNDVHDQQDQDEDDHEDNYDGVHDLQDAEQSAPTVTARTPDMENMMRNLTKDELQLRNLSRISGQEFASTICSVNSEMLYSVLCRLEPLIWYLGKSFVDVTAFIQATRPYLVRFIENECYEDDLDVEKWDSDMIQSFSRRLANKFFVLVKHL